MRKIINLLSAAAAFLAGLNIYAAEDFRIMDCETAYHKADSILKTFSVEEKCLMVRGYEKFFIRGYANHGLRPVFMCDASMGLRLSEKLPENLIRQLDSSTAFPSSVLLASTFNPELSYEYARALGEECRAGGVDILLGPGINITRQARCGRTFEYMGEDPYLTGTMAAEYVRGLQSTGTAACIKHFIGNQTEWYRKSSNSIIDPRTIHEIYLPAFKKCIDAGAMSLMTAYNMLNGTHAGENRELIKGILREELGFKWLVMSDWESIWDLERMVHSGQNIEMPGDWDFGTGVQELFDEGKITMEELDDMVRPILATCIAMGFYERPQYDSSYSERIPEHVKTARKVAREGIVLLKNNGILPLSGGKKILLTGKFIDEVPRGKGSSIVTGYNNTLLGRELAGIYGDDLLVCKNPGLEEIRKAEVVILSCGTVDSENRERPFELPEEEEKWICSVVEANPNTIIVMNTGNATRMTAFNDKAAAILYGWYPGQEGQAAMAEIISGAVNPSGKLPLTIEKNFADSPGANTLPKGAQFFNELKNERMIKFYDVHYDEGVLVGYRWYDTKGIEPLYHFGHGLSYTSFSLGKGMAEVTPDGRIKCEVTLRNTGRREGKEVVQLYVGEKSPSVVRPVKELKAFRKVSLAPGERRRLEFVIEPDEIGFWDSAENGWKTNGGKYVISVGTSSGDTPLNMEISL